MIFVLKRPGFGPGWFVGCAWLASVLVGLEACSPETPIGDPSTGGFGGASPTGGAMSTGGESSGGGAPGGTAGAAAETLTWGFSNDQEGWNGGFADYPPDSGTGYGLRSEWSALPAEVGPGGGLLVSGNNHSDDLFMYLGRQITGLAPQTTYLLDVVVVIDTNAPSDCGGIGGAPGGSVFFKIGAVPFEPATSLDGLGWLRLNLDKGNQSAGGADMKVVGDIGNTLACPDATYQPKTLTLSAFAVQTGANGSLWVILGTDSGFEGITTLYYDRVAVTLRPSP
jgi:hypothetical protein